MSQETLPPEAQTFIVQSLACFDAPSVVAKAVKDELGLIVSRQRVEAYDPTKRAGGGLSGRWRELFDATRAAFLESSAEIGISHRVVRLRTLNRLIEQAEARGNIVVTAQLLEQAAKEAGNAFTNKRELTGKDGAPLPAAPAIAIYTLPDNGRG